MLGKLFGMGAKLRFALWVAGRIMPSAKDVRPHVGKALAGAIALVACGVFAVVGLVTAVIAVYLYATGLAVAHQTALFFLSAGSLLISFLGFLIARRSVTEALSVSDKTKKASDKLDTSISATVDSTLNAFLDGLMTPPEPRQRDAQTTKEEPVTQNSDANDKVVPIIQGHASAREILHQHPKTQTTY